MELEIRHLRLVRAVATLGGLTSAGRLLHLSQSALSHQLRDVEERLGTRLFLRAGKRMVLTAAGERLLRSADEVLGTLDRTAAALKQFADGRRGRLRVMAGASDYHWLPRVLKTFRRLCPAVDVQIAGGSGAPLALLLEAAVDVAIVADAISDERIATRALFDDEVVAVVEPSSALARRGALRPQDLAGHDVLLDRPLDGHAVGQQVVRSGLAPAMLRVVEHPSALAELVAAGFGVGLAPRWSVERALRGGRVTAVRLATDGVAVTWRAAMLNEIAGVSFISQFLEVMSTHASLRAVHPTGDRATAAM